jgi:uncharacterized protein YciI
MFILLLTYTKPLDDVDRWLDEHRAWVKQGFDDGVFVLAGGQRPRVGGAILAIGESKADLEDRAAQDPFVRHGVATTQVIEVRPTAVDGRIGLLGDS